jgi:outer membrane protein assembly factor BamD
MMRSGLITSLVVLGLAGCSTSSSQTKPDTSAPPDASQASPSSQSHEDQPLAGDHLGNGPTLHGFEGRPEAGFAPDAATNLKHGEEALSDHNYDEASKYFEYVRTHYPFQDASKLAELRLADTDFAKGEWDSARDRYSNFVKAHPSNAQADYAQFQAALTFYKDAPSGFFLLPPSYEKDLSSVQSALTAMRSFAKEWPDSKHVPEAHEVITSCAKLLAEHEMYVSDFYAKRDHLAGAAQRLETLVKDYGDSGLTDDALFKLHDLYGKLKEPAKAKDALQRLIARTKDAGAASRAKKLLGS